jgi:hypothetical protein
VRHARTLALAALLAGVLVAAARAQAPADRLAAGIRAYQSLDYDSAATYLRTALAASGPQALADSDRMRALVYLGATDVFRQRRDTAAAVFRRILYQDPRYRIDQLIFPPDVTNVFEEVRLTTRAVAVVVPHSTLVSAAGDRLVFWLYAASYHPVTVEIVPPGHGRPLTLYDGGLSDSLQLLWAARRPDGSPLDSGSYQLRVQSRAEGGQVVRTVTVGLDLTRVVGDTAPFPPPPADSLLKPEGAPGGTGVRGLLAGLGGFLAVAVLPSFVAGHGGTSNRFIVGGALGIAGLAAIPLRRRPQPIPANIAANDALRHAWRQQVDSVKTANAEVRREAPLLITAGAPEVEGTP